MFYFSSKTLPMCNSFLYHFFKNVSSLKLYLCATQWGLSPLPFSNILFFHTFSAVWLWSNVVSVLISVTTDIRSKMEVSLKVTTIFFFGVVSLTGLPWRHGDHRPALHRVERGGPENWKENYWCQSDNSAEFLNAAPGSYWTPKLN